jgi:hypothetical protein
VTERPRVRGCGWWIGLDVFVVLVAGRFTSSPTGEWLVVALSLAAADPVQVTAAYDQPGVW